MLRWLTYLLLGTLLGLGCKPEPEELAPPVVSEISQKWLDVAVPPHFPEIVYPEDNRPTVERVHLGKLLFHDVRLSRDHSVSCASCHLQEHAFADPEQVSSGVDGLQGFRNAPSLSNIGWHPHLFMDGGVPNLELQALAPLDNEVEMDHSIVEVSDELRYDETYSALARKAYGRDFDPFVLTHALAAFQRTLISGNSAWDRYTNGDLRALSDDQIAGMELFFSERSQCSSCHKGVFLSDFTFRNIGLYEVYEDAGRQRVTADPNDNGKFKVPSLRNVALTAPYMHDGSMNTLEEVVDHYTTGGQNHPLKDSLMEPLNLTLREKAQLVSFMKALTDLDFVSDTAFAVQP